MAVEFAPYMKCSMCGCKFFGESAKTHEPGSDNCAEWKRDRLEHLRDQGRDY